LIPETTAQSLVFSTVRREVESQDFIGNGTGFILELTREEGYAYFVVTNKHVIADAEIIKIYFLRSSEQGILLGRGYMLTSTQSDWVLHPNLDIAMLPLSQYLTENIQDPNEIYFTRIEENWILNDSHLGDIDYVEEVSFFGYPIGLWDTNNLTPIHRRGVTATPIALDFEGEQYFLIDASVFHGSSGSPVFIMDVGGTYFSPARKGTVVGKRVIFLGMLTDGYYRDEQGSLCQSQIPISQEETDEIHEMIDIGGVIKSTVIFRWVTTLLDERLLETG
jgi:hypothetical protein